MEREGACEIPADGCEDVVVRCRPKLDLSTTLEKKSVHDVSAGG
jgi:hypothetical protein